MDVKTLAAASCVLQGGAIFAERNVIYERGYVAINEDRIIDIGEGDAPSSLIGDSTDVRTFSGDALIMPGLHDNHVHAVLAGMLIKYANLFGVKSQDECVRIVGECADMFPEEEWVIGFGFCRWIWEDSSEPVKELLDAALPDRPVLLLDYELHAAWVNSKALSICGVDANTPDPVSGRIVRDKEANPTGYLIETALSLVARGAFDFSAEVAEDLIRRYTDTAKSFGITSASDMTPYLGIDLSFEEAFLSLAKRGGLDVRMYAALDLFSDPREWKEKAARARSVPGGMYDIKYMKQFIDGILANYTALMIDDYCTAPGNKGSSLLDLDKLNEAVKKANVQGIPVRLHACGDGAVRAALDAYEYACSAIGTGDEANEKSGYEKGFPRNQTEHIEVIAPEDIERFTKLGVIASVQPEHIISGMTSDSENCYPEYLGKQRDRFTWPFRTMKDAGAVLAMGSDMPVVEGNPFEGIYVGLTRIFDDGTPIGGWNPEEKLGIEDLLEGYTLGAAFAEGMEQKLGTLRPGMLADIAVIDKNLMHASPEEIRKASALLTMVGGRITYEA